MKLKWAIHGPDAQSLDMIVFKKISEKFDPQRNSSDGIGNF
jgi:hypothetical protein